LMKRPLLVMALLVIGVTAYGLIGWPGEKIEPEIPAPPFIPTPKPLELWEPLETFVGESMDVTIGIVGKGCRDCLLTVKGRDGIVISSCTFVNSKIVVEDSSDFEFSLCRLDDYYVHEDAALQIHGSSGVLLDRCEVVNNSVGVAIGNCSDVEIMDCLFEGNDQHNAVTGLDCRGARIHGNLFRFNFPHALMITNWEGDPLDQLDIYGNVFDRNIEDAINFEEFRGQAEATLVRGNLFNGTSWAGVNVEYNSWNANIVIEGNYIDRNGLLVEDILEDGRPTSVYPAHSHQPEPYSAGWGHGIMLEDCCGVTVARNVIVSNVESGIDVKNARDIVVENNTIALNRVGVYVAGYQESSLIRDFSPLALVDSGFSEVTKARNSVFLNVEEDWLVEEGSTVSSTD